MRTRFKFNGLEYTDVDEMPPDVRRAFERVSGMLKDEDGDGIPDIVQDENGELTVVHKARYTINGVTYNDPNDMPEDVRRTYEQMMGPVDADEDGIPDALQLGRHRPLSMSAGESRQPPTVVQSHAAPSEMKRDRLIIVLLTGIFVCLIALVALVVWAVRNTS